jgi:hypothetical protein
MKNYILNIIYLSLILTSISEARAQLVDDANLSVQTGSGSTFTETIKIISNSKKIFILTNGNQQLNPGDFISLALNDQLAARALVAKTHQGQVGIKILKIYSLAQWGRLRRDQQVQIIKGDDSGFARRAAPAEEAPAAGRIRNEEDLFTKDVIVGDVPDLLEEESRRHIRPDNLVAVSVSRFSATEIPSRGGTATANEFLGSWAFQFRDNFYLEGIYGRSLLTSYPNDGIATVTNRLVGRLKFNIKGPLFTFFMPYVGYQNISASSPRAGEPGVPEAQEELDAIANVERSGPVVGITVLRRLVPGWFVKADLGTDVLNLGFAVEF